MCNSACVAYSQNGTVISIIWKLEVWTDDSFSASGNHKLTLSFVLQICLFQLFHVESYKYSSPCDRRLLLSTVLSRFICDVMCTTLLCEYALRVAYPPAWLAGFLVFIFFVVVFLLLPLCQCTDTCELFSWQCLGIELFGHKITSFNLMRNCQTCSKELATLFLSNIELPFFHFYKHLLLFFFFK